VPGVWRIIEDHYPGYDLKRKIADGLLPEGIAAVTFPGMKFDDELKVVW